MSSYQYGGARSAPKCASIWEYLNSVNSKYADAIEDICARDFLADSLGLTVIIPDDEFIKVFIDNIRGSGSATTARRMLLNTVIKRFLPDAENFGQWRESLPLRSQMKMKVESIDGDSVTLEGGVKIEKDKKFKSPEGFRYAIWHVVEGNYTTSTPTPVLGKKRPPRPKEDNRESVMVEGGGHKDQYIVNLGKILRDSPDTQRVFLVGCILNDYKQEMHHDKCARRNPLLTKAVSLYNWLSMYYPETLSVLLPTTDIHPGVNLMVSILDPNSILTQDLLFGTGNPTDPVHLQQGWRSADVYANPSAEWSEYVDSAAKTIPERAAFFEKINEFRNSLVRGTRLDHSDATEKILAQYRLFGDSGSLLGVKVIPDVTYKTLYEGAQFRDRKLWQDQMRFVCTCAFEGVATARFVDDDEDLENAVRFRPTQSYTSAATMTYITNHFMAKDEYFACMKWLFSTDFMYIPDTLTGAGSLSTFTSEPYNGEHKGTVKAKSILNHHRTKAQLLSAMAVPYQVSPSVVYSIQWLAGKTVPNASTGDVKGGMPNRGIHKNTRRHGHGDVHSRRLHQADGSDDSSEEAHGGFDDAATIALY
jgi:hypothetical protein